MYLLAILKVMFTEVLMKLSQTVQTILKYRSFSFLSSSALQYVILYI